VASEQVLGREPRFLSAPLGLFDASIGALDLLGRFSAKARDAAELARIGTHALTVLRFGHMRLHFWTIATDGSAAINNSNSRNGDSIFFS
jgi:hypothetical protein